MGSRYLTDLAQVCRDAGLKVVEYSGWQTRARGSGGYDSGRPTHVMVHHTASPPSWSGQKDADYCALGDEDAPLSNLCLDQSGCVWVLAAGATNTNGKGSDWWGGGVPTDSMNSYAIGIEANGGYGSAWPQVQQDAYVKLVKKLCSQYGIPNNNVRGHFEWAPTRKVDPAGPSKWASGSASWDMNGFRRDCVGAPEPGPTPEPEPTEEEDVIWRVAKLDPSAAYYIGDGTTSYFVNNDGGDIDMDEALCRMAPGAVNVIRVTWDKADDSNSGPRMVTNWGQIKSYMQQKQLKKYVGNNKRFG